jgi:ABC-type uncharacterized transport system substrate-binding protein
MTVLRLFLVCFFLLISQLACATEARRPFRILHVMSFHSPYRWTDGQLAGFKQGLGADVRAEYRILQMDANRNKTVQEKEQKGLEASALIDSWKPDLIYTSDDDAARYVLQPHINCGIPMVFSGVNKNPEDYGFEAASNVTGVLEREHFLETVQLLKSIAPNIRRLAIISDDGPQFVPMLQRIEASKSRLSDIEVVSTDLVKTYAEFQKKILSYQSNADAILLLGIFTLRDEKGQSVPYPDVLRWMVEHSKLPDASFWIDRIFHGTLAAMTVSEQAQGLAAGQLARQILLEKRRPSSLPMLATAKGHPAINLARARQLGFKIRSSQLLSAEVIPSYQWAR